MGRVFFVRFRPSSVEWHCSKFLYRRQNDQLQALYRKKRSNKELHYDLRAHGI